MSNNLEPNMTYLTNKIQYAYIIKNNKNFIVVEIIYVKMYFQVANIKKITRYV